MTIEAKKSLVASIVIVLALGFLYLTLAGLPPSVNEKPHQGLGQVMGEEAVKLLGHGGRIAVIARKTTDFKTPAAEAQLKAFNQTISKGGAKVAVTRWLRPNPISVVAVPSGEFFDVLRRQSDSDVTVSFMGPAELADGQIAKLGEQRPKVIALCTGTLPH